MTRPETSLPVSIPRRCAVVGSVTGRIDHKITDKNTIHGRLSTNWSRYIRYIDYPALIRTRTRPELAPHRGRYARILAHGWSTPRASGCTRRLSRMYLVNGFTPVKATR